jgi:hypothetical protein
MAFRRILAGLFFFALVASVAVAQTNLNGSWRALLSGNGQRCSIDLVMGPGQRYSEMVRCGNMMTRQAGTYTFARGILMRQVSDWDPKQRYVMDNGYSGHYEWNAKPPGGSYKVDFTGRDTMVWRDVNMGGTVTFRRLQ